MDTWMRRHALHTGNLEFVTPYNSGKAAHQQTQELVTEWFDREIERPTSSAHFRTVTVMGKPYHWRQDYTGQLKLAPGESPW